MGRAGHIPQINRQNSRPKGPWENNSNHHVKCAVFGLKLDEQNGSLRLGWGFVLRFFLRLQNFILPLGILLLGAALQLLQPYPVEFVRNLVFDQYNRWQPRDEQGSPVVFVDIDEASLERIGQFPWPRSVFAELVNRMTDNGAAAIAFDILFTEADRTAPSEILPVWQSLRAKSDPEAWDTLRADINRLISSPDDAFARAMREAPVIMATMMNDEVRTLPTPKAGIALRAQNLSDDNVDADPMRGLPSSDYAIANRPVLDDSAVGLGSINARIDDDGIIRRASLLFRAGDNIYPGLALESLRVAQPPVRSCYAPQMFAAKGHTHRALDCRA